MSAADLQGDQIILARNAHKSAKKARFYARQNNTRIGRLRLWIDNSAEHSARPPAAARRPSIEAT